MADEALARCVATLSAVFIFGGDITRAEDREHQRPGQYGPIDPFVLGVTPLISVERVLASDDPIKWNAYFNNLYDDPAMAQTLVQETVGVGQLWAGHAPKFGAPYRGFLDPLEDR